MICVDWEADKEDGQKWFSEARIMSGFVSVVRSGAKVVNFSLGSSGNIVNGTTDRYQFVKDIEGKFTSYIMAKLLQKGYDFICCQSAGNGVDMKDGTSYAVDSSNNGTFSTVTKKNAVNFVKGVTPQDIVDRIIIVASAKYDGQNSYSQSYFSNGGSTVSICAPGSSVYSTYYDRENQDHNYAYLSGTSMAAPVVTAVTALVWSVNPSFTGGEVKHFVCDLENTKYMAADSDDENHLPTGEIPMVNAQLAVEAAIKATYGCGTVEGVVDNMLDENDAINIEITSEYGRVYRTIADETGAFSLLLPQGEYTLSRVGKEEYDAEFTVTADETVTLETVILSKDNTALHAQNAMDIFKDALVEADII